MSRRGDAMLAATPITIPVRRRTLDAYLVLPSSDGKPRPAVVVIHEIFGPDAHIQDMARRFAKEGYVALAPNLFTGPIEKLLTPQAVMQGFGFLRSLPPEVQRDPAKIRAAIAAKPPEERAVLEGLSRIQDPEEHRRFAEDLAGVTEYLRGRPEVDGSRIASVGFCFGGAMSGLLSATDPKLAGAVIFYGNNPPADLIPKIRCPLLGHYGAEDHRITDTVDELAGSLARSKVPFTYFVYPGAGHAFMNDTRAQMYHEESAKLAWQRTLEFLRTTFRSDGSRPRSAP